MHIPAKNGVNIHFCHKNNMLSSMDARMFSRCQYADAELLMPRLPITCTPKATPLIISCAHLHNVVHGTCTKFENSYHSMAGLVRFL